MKLFGIKFYNPFKPHIVVDSFGVYWVRKYELFFGWMYYDGGHYWHNRTYANYSLSLVSAKERLEDAQKYLILEKDRSKKKKTSDKVVHGY